MSDSANKQTPELAPSEPQTPEPLQWRCPVCTGWNWASDTTCQFSHAGIAEAPSAETPKVYERIEDTSATYPRIEVPPEGLETLLKEADTMLGESGRWHMFPGTLITRLRDALRALLASHATTEAEACTCGTLCAYCSDRAQKGSK